MNTGVIGTTEKKSIRYYAFTISKRLFDLICSFIGVLVLIPLMVFIKIAYILHKDFNSIFYTQDRVGKNGKLFKIYKFRTMIPNADEVLDKILKEDPLKRREYKINKKLKDDPRVTKVGKFLRVTSLDEMPQFINVLIGDMSVIGNRPYLPKEIKDMGKYYEDIIKTKPGITGYWQVSGRSNTTFEDRCRLESQYSDMISIKLDTKIFFKTFKVVAGKNGAK